MVDLRFTALKVRHRWGTEQRRALEFAHHQSLRPIKRALTQKSLSEITPPQWERGRAAIREHFPGLTRTTHCFNAVPIKWARFTEPQITKGLAYFLKATPTTSAGRVNAFLRALQRPDPSTRVLLSEGRQPTLHPEFPVGGGAGRIDLLVEWLDESDRRCLVALECKFDHRLTKYQLSKYATHMRRRVPDDGRRRLFLVSPRRRECDQAYLKKNPEWAHLSWISLVRRLEAEMQSSECYDDDEYRKFRRTIFEMSM